MIFKDRIEAGQKLAEKLIKYKEENPIIYALPRGGVVLGDIVAKELNAPLDLVIPRKIGHQFDPEYAICAVTESADLVCNPEEMKNVDKNWFEKEKEKEIQEAKRRREVYAGGKRIDPKDKTAIIVDDGVATGLTVMAAIKEIKNLKPKKLIVAVPVVPSDAAEKIKNEVDELVALDIDKNYLGAVGAYYENFPQVEDEEVIKILKNHERSK